MNDGAVRTFAYAPAAPDAARTYAVTSRVDGAGGREAEVLDPSLGRAQAVVPLASKAEVDDVVARAAEAQRTWGATNPQKRARVLSRFVDLVHENADELARLLSSEHGKTVPDAKGDIQRGLEVIEVAIGAPHLLKGEYTESAGGGIDVYSMRQPLGVVAGITPFNFPAMIPLWKAGPALAAGNAFVLKPSERDPGAAMILAELARRHDLLATGSSDYHGANKSTPIAAETTAPAVLEALVARVDRARGTTPVTA